VKPSKLPLTSPQGAYWRLGNDKLLFFSENTLIFTDKKNSGYLVFCEPLFFIFPKAEGLPDSSDTAGTSGWPELPLRKEI